jgi:hypothetical protein
MDLTMYKFESSADAFEGVLDVFAQFFICKEGGREGGREGGKEGGRESSWIHNVSTEKGHS